VELQVVISLLILKMGFISKHGESQLVSRSSMIKLTEISNQSDMILIQFGDAIRSGSTQLIAEILAKIGPGIIQDHMLSFDVTLRKLAATSFRSPTMSTWHVPDAVTKNERMSVTPFQLAIIAMKGSVVDQMLEAVMASAKNPHAFLRMILSSKSKMTYVCGLSSYCKDDRVLDGINAFHLAAKYHAPSLLSIIQLLQQEDLVDSMIDLLEAQDSHMGKTPLHLAVKSPSSLSTKMLLRCGAQVDVRDNRGYTALHMAVKRGNETNSLTLLENNADPNAYGDKPNFHKMPLHRARSKKVVQLLLQHGANPYAKMIDSTCKKDSPITPIMCENVCCEDVKPSSVFDLLLERHPSAVEELLNSYVKTNGQDMDSSDFELIYNFEIFFKEGLQAEFDDISDVDTSDINEMAVHTKIIEMRQRVLLKHPLVEAFLHIKWQLMKKFVIANVVQYTIFLVVLTVLAILQTKMTKCYPEDDNTSQSILLGCTDHHKWNVTNFYTILEHHWSSSDGIEVTEGIAFMVFYCLTGIGFLVLFIRELLQAIYVWKNYIQSLENLLEAFLIIFTGLYMVVTFIHIDVAIHFGAWAVFCAWLEMTLLIGRNPSFGVFIHMSINVMKTLLVFIGVYSPVLVAFAVTFHLLLPSKDVFSNPLTSLIKVLAMMTGEFDLPSYFTWDQSMKDHAQFSTQLLFIMFLIFVSIVIANLLIGLTISKTGEVFMEAGLFRLEQTVLQILGVRSIFFQPKPGSGILPKSWGKVINKKCMIFTYLKSMLPPTMGQVKPWLVSVKPFDCSHGMTHGINRMILDNNSSLIDTSASSFDKSYAVYVYDDRLGEHGPKLAYTLPAWVIVNTLKFFQDQKVNNDKAIAKEIEADFAQQQNAKESLQDLIRQTVSSKTEIRPRFEKKVSVDVEQLTPKPSRNEVKKSIRTFGQISSKDDCTPVSLTTHKFGPSQDCQSSYADPDSVQSLSKELKQLQSDIQELKKIILDLKKVK
jgi:hypothetical protein